MLEHFDPADHYGWAKATGGSCKNSGRAAAASLNTGTATRCGIGAQRWPLASTQAQASSGREIRKPQLFNPADHYGWAKARAAAAGVVAAPQQAAAPAQPTAAPHSAARPQQPRSDWPSDKAQVAFQYQRIICSLDQMPQSACTALAEI